MNTITPALTIGQTRLLATVIKTTRNMLALAEDEAWDAVADLEILRRENLKRCFEIPVGENQGELVAEALAVILHLNEELMSRLQVSRDVAREEGSAQARSLEAVVEYQSIQLVR
ncbi:MAG: flagellar protein FliT [Luminiphilus sp.]|nr:flagellar protein FliT [Luminiphilus sp.]